MKPGLFKPLRDVKLEKYARMLLEYCRNLLRNMIDVTFLESNAKRFNSCMKLVLTALIDVVSSTEIGKFVKDFEIALSYVWKILTSICEQQDIASQRSLELDKSDAWQRITVESLPMQLLALFCRNQLAQANSYKLQHEAYRSIYPDPKEEGIKGKSLTELSDIADKYE
mmetsp:Transcript_30447/g.40493  ORF Transcript_30447/g.40493 Transcript_30447/m.40493 type:complete len:169 (-) Transcript_30447:426-932(-)